MKTKFWLAVAAFLAPFTSQAAIDVRVQEHWLVKVGSVVYEVEVIEIKDDVVRIKYGDGLIGRAVKGDVKWLTKLSSEYI